MSRSSEAIHYGEARVRTGPGARLPVTGPRIRKFGFLLSVLWLGMAGLETLDLPQQVLPAVVGHAEKSPLMHNH